MCFRTLWLAWQLLPKKRSMPCGRCQEVIAASRLACVGTAACMFSCCAGEPLPARSCCTLLAATYSESVCQHVGGAHAHQPFNVNVCASTIIWIKLMPCKRSSSGGSRAYWSLHSSRCCCGACGDYHHRRRHRVNPNCSLNSCWFLAQPWPGRDFHPSNLAGAALVLERAQKQQICRLHADNKLSASPYQRRSHL